MLPEGWKRQRLSELVSSVDAGVSVNGEDRPATSNELGVLKVSCVSSGIFVAQQNKAILAREMGRARTWAKADRVIVSRSNTEALVGASAYVARDYPKLFLSDKLWQLEPSEDGSVYMRWLAYWLSSTPVRKILASLGTGTSGSMKNISKEELLGLWLHVPSVAEQQGIARVLDTWEAAVISTQRLLANSRRQKDSLISKLLMPVPTPARGRSMGSSFPASVQPGIPQLPPTPPGWRKTTLGQLLKEVPRPVALESDQAYTLVTVRRSRGGVDERGVLLGREIKTPSQFWVNAGDFLISKRQIVHGACGIVPTSLDGAVVSNEYAVLNTHDGLDARFLAYLAETTYFQQTCFHSSIGVHVEKMLFKLDRWLTWPFNIPPIDVQRRIVAQLDLATHQIRSIESQLELLEHEKRVLMADLLTGKRRVHLQEVTAEPKAA